MAKEKKATKKVADKAVKKVKVEAPKVVRGVYDKRGK